MTKNLKDSELNGPISQPSHKMDTDRRVHLEPIAIIGMGCRFPGAKDPEAFWQLLQDGVDAITEVPADRFDIDTVYDPRPAVPGKMRTRWGGFLEQVDQFDPFFFGISPREANRMDPQQRLLLEVAWEALEDAGQVPAQLAGRPRPIGVFIGIINDDYKDLQLSDGDLTDIDVYAGTGMARSVASGRLSYALGLQGPSLTVDTACSSSLVAVHLACQSLWGGQCTTALAGGVNLILEPYPTIAFSQADMVAPDGRCKFCDARADGFVRSDGVGIVVLKPVSMAQRDGDPIYAVIRGSAVNNDGNSSGLLMTPSQKGQEAVLRQAYRDAGVPPGRVHYVEAHGTGTSVGDPVELQALGTVLAEGRPKDRPCVIGSVKTNIGHTEGAAGIAGLIKAALSLKHRVIPPSLHFQEPNPNIPWQDLPLMVQQELSSWPADSEPALAGVSSFGISGTNAHIVLEEAPQTTPAQKEVPAQTTKAQLLPLSAHSPEALEAMVRAYQMFMATKQDRDTPSLQDICYTASVRRAHHDHRLALVVHSQEELAERLEAFLEEMDLGMSPGAGHTVPEPQRKLVFVFSGQGSQWVGMGRALLEQEPVFREALERCDRAIQPYVDWSLMEELAADEAQSRLDQVDVIQPMIFAVQVALAALWHSWGIEPDAVVGQSMGEVAAAHVAGALSLEDAARIICRRSQLVKRTSGQGGMAVVGLPLEEAQRALDGYEDHVSVAVSSSPSSTVLSGDATALKEIVDRLERQEIFCRWIKVDYASHSPYMDPLQPDLLKAVDGVQPRSASVPFYSTVTREVSDGRDLDATYWVRNLREPVLLSKVVQQLLEDGHHTFLEISPHPLLLSAFQQGLQHLGQEGIALPSLQREEEERTVMLEALGTLYSVGHPVDWSGLYSSGGQCVRLPSYPWQREHFWWEDLGASGDRIWKRSSLRRGGSATSGHPLLGPPLKSAAHSGTHFWEIDLGVDWFPYLADHRVQGAIVLPAAVYVEMALAAAEEAFGVGPHVLEKVVFKKALFLPEDGAPTVQLVVSPEMPGTASFQLFSLQADEAQPQVEWTLHATAMIRLGRTDETTPPVEHASPEEIQARYPQVISGAEHYQAVEERGLQYGPSFQGVEQIWYGDGEAVGQLRLPETVASEAGAYQVHPALLDTCFQVMGPVIPVVPEATHLYLPVGLDRLRVYDRPGTGTGLWSHVRLQPGIEADTDTLKGDVFLLDEEGRVVLEALGMSIQRLDRDTQRATGQDINDWFYEIQWERQARPQPTQVLEALSPDQQGSWVIFADSRGVAQTLRSLLEERGETCVMVSPGETYQIVEPGHYQLDPTCPEDFRQLLEDALGPDQPACRAVVHLWSLEATPPAETTLTSLEAAQELGCVSVLHLIQAGVEADRIPSPRLWLVTRGAQAVRNEEVEEIEPVSIAQAPLWGLGRVIANEHPKFRCTEVDLDPNSAGAVEEIESLFQELWPEDTGSEGPTEDQIAFRGDARYVARLARRPEFDEKRRTIPGDQPFRLEISKPGILDNLTLRETTRQPPGPGEVEIRVYATGLNFLDVLSAMGLYPDGFVPLGIECAGKVTTLGEDVEGFQIGDEVIAFAINSFASYVTTMVQFVVPKPAHLSFAEAATIPAAFLTAYYALYHLGRLREGERVLIHSASGGVGLAAVQLAQQMDADIFATAGRPEKREFLRSLDIEHVMDSRSLDFADEVMKRTDGEGVDLVLNSLAGEAISKGLSTLRAYGRFLELGKRDIYQNTPLGLSPFRKSLSFYAIDLSRMFKERPALAASLFREVMEQFQDGRLKPLLLQVFPISDAVAAFRTMAQAKHIGKIVLALQDQEVSVAPASDESARFGSDGTYLITGGLGGLGLSVAQWMVKQGARHLVLMGRSGASAAAQEALDAMEEVGAQVVVAKADVAQQPQVADVLAEIDRSMPPLSGIIHAAGVLDDGILLQLDRARFKSVMAPKISGAWNLHTLTLDKPLDLFVLFSSSASLLGSPGQGNYVAANAFLDALAYHRHALGLPALAINWGAWAEVGLAARPDRSKRLALGGILPFTPEQGLQMMEQLLGQDSAQVMAISVDWVQLLSVLPAGRRSALYSQLAKARQKEDDLTRDALLAADPEQRQSLLESYLQEQVARALGLAPSRLDLKRSVTTLGLDSLMAMELKNRIEASLGMELPVTSLLQGPSVAELATELLNQLPASSSDGDIAKLTQILDKLDQLSEEEVKAMLEEKRLAAEDKENVHHE
ncbi:MAG: SDR family NAD(P)-dependent oxidoreductase [Candidatus Bipolaricaulia bacterium]